MQERSDLKIVEPDGPFLKVDQIRALQRELSLTANEGGWRVALLVDSDRLRLQAANALLKTLEEPRDRTTLILLASSASGLPRTILSRTTRLRFAPESAESVETTLRGEGFEADDAWLAAALGGASVAAARRWSERWLEPARELYEALEELSGATASDVLDFAEGFRGGAAARERAELLIQVHGALARRAVEDAARKRDTPGVERGLVRAEAGERARLEMASNP